MNNYLDNLPKPFLALAPMDDVTDTVFRRIIGDCSPPDLYFTEFVSVDGLQSPGKPRLMKKLAFDSEAEQPIIAQIWGKNPDNYRKTAQELVRQGFRGIDINMGCPVKAVIQNGCCGALIKNHPLASDIIKATRAGTDGQLPLSVKTRLGFFEPDMHWIEFLLSQKLNMLSIHMRTVKEMSKVPARFGLLDEIITLRDKIAPDTLLVANGDVDDKAHAVELYKRYRIDGFMIGRGVFSNPFAFSDEKQWEKFTPFQKAGLYEKHVRLFRSTWRNNERPIVTLNKFCKIYINGFDGAKELREKLMQSDSADELLSRLGDLKARLQ
jgi:tRNA-dihydrouridine synthase